MDRREFVCGAAAFASSRGIFDQSVVSVPLALPNTNPRLMPVDFTGLSYEAGQLYNPEFFSSRNAALVNAFLGLSHKGVLRLGGHLSNITPWEGVGQDDPKQQRGVRHGIEDYWEWPLVDPVVQQNKRGILTRKAISNLRGFLDAVDWRLIYGLNFACGSAARAADEAEAVASVMGDKLVAFVTPKTDIDGDAVTACVGNLPTSTVFDLADALRRVLVCQVVGGEKAAPFAAVAKEVDVCFAFAGIEFAEMKAARPVRFIGVERSGRELE